MTTGIKDQDLIILDKLDDKSLFELCKTNKYIQRFCKDENFWKERLFKNYGKIEKNKNRTWKDFYLNIVYYDNKLRDDDSTGFGFVKTPGSSLIILSRKGIKNIDLINFFINKGVDKDDLNYAMEEAAKVGDKKLVDFLIDKGADDWNRGMLGAIEAGKLSLVRFFVRKSGRNPDLNLGLRYAAREGDRAIAEYFIEKGAYNLTEALEEALEEKDYEMINFLQRTIKFRKWHYSRTPTKKYFYV